MGCAGCGNPHTQKIRQEGVSSVCNDILNPIHFVPTRSTKATTLRTFKQVLYICESYTSCTPITKGAICEKGNPMAAKSQNTCTRACCRLRSYRYNLVIWRQVLHPIYNGAGRLQRVSSRQKDAAGNQPHTRPSYKESACGRSVGIRREGARNYGPAQSWDLVCCPLRTRRM